MSETITLQELDHRKIPRNIYRRIFVVRNPFSRDRDTYFYVQNGQQQSKQTVADITGRISKLHEVDLPTGIFAIKTLDTDSTYLRVSHDPQIMTVTQVKAFIQHHINTEGTLR